MSALRSLGEPALERLDKVLDEKPSDVEIYDELAAAGRDIIHLRDHLIARRRDGDAAASPWLAQVNTLLSMLHGAEYPLTGVHWQRIAKSREMLRAIVDSA